MELKYKLKELRVQNGLTQQQIADILCIPRSTYKNYESGLASPDFNLLVQIADFYHLSVDEILGREKHQELFNDARIQILELKNLREIKGLTQKEVAQALEIAVPRYSRYERGEREADYETLEKLADFFNVTIDELLGHKKPGSIFDDARIPKTPEQELFDSLTPFQQERVMAYMKGFADSNEERRQENNNRKHA